MSRTMKAAVLHGREDVRIESMPVPSIEGGEVLLRNHVALTCGTDVKVFRRGYHARMIVPPAVFGHEVSGVVEEVGPEVESVRPGMAVVVAVNVCVARGRSDWPESPVSLASTSAIAAAFRHRVA